MAAEDSATEIDTEGVIVTILELRQRIEDLLATLPPEVRAEVERRWTERRIAADSPDPKSDDEAPTTGGDPTPTAEMAIITPDATARPDGGRPCGAFHLLDTDESAVISGGDRQWRYLRIWFDDGDELVQDEEIESLFELGVREIDAGLRFYSRRDGETEDIDADERIVLHMLDSGGKGGRSGVLAIDADRLSRDGVFRLTDAAGAPLTGLQALGTDTYLVSGDEQRVPVLCLPPREGA